MAKSSHAKPGCFSDFFHHLFCAENGNSSPMHPNSNPITKPHASEVVHGHNTDAMVNATKPGVVARLMGLDSLPSTNLVSNINTSDSVTRSRSVNFVDYLLKFDTSQANNHQVKTSASFREVPASIREVPASFDQNKNKNHDLVVFYWDSGSEDHEVESLLRIQEMGSKESRQRKKQGRKNKEIVGVTKERNLTKRKKLSQFENEPRVISLKHGPKVRNNNEAKVLAPVSACSKSCNNRRKGGSGPSGLRTSSKLPNKQKKVLSESKLPKKTRKQQSTEKIQTACSTENFSPISVLDDYDLSYLYGPDFPDYTSSLMPKTKKWEFSEELFLDDNVGDRASKDKEYSYPEINNNKKEYLSELTVKLCKFTENGLNEADFTRKGMCEGEKYEEICLEYEHKIFDILLHEVVNELVELSY